MLLFLLKYITKGVFNLKITEEGTNKAIDKKHKPKETIEFQTIIE